MCQQTQCHPIMPSTNLTSRWSSWTLRFFTWNAPVAPRTSNILAMWCRQKIRNIALAWKSDFDWFIQTTVDQSTIRSVALLNSKTIIVQLGKSFQEGATWIQKIDLKGAGSLIWINLDHASAVISVIKLWSSSPPSWYSRSSVLCEGKNKTN